MIQKTHEVQRGNVARQSFKKIKEVTDIPYLIEVQKNSYDNFIKLGIQEVFDDYSPMVDIGNKFSLEFLSYSLEDKCKWTIDECKVKEATYSVQMKAKVRLTHKQTEKMLESEVFMGDMPMMTDSGTFIINGAERVVVSQLVRSPGVYTGKGTLDRKGTERFETQIIPSRGAWLEFQQDAHGSLTVRIDRARRISATLLLKALNVGAPVDAKDKETPSTKILRLFGDDEIIKTTLDKDGEIDSLVAARKEAFTKLKPGEQQTDSGVANHLTNLLFERRRYDLAKVGRFKFNKHLSIANRIKDKTAAEDIISTDGEVLVEAGKVIDRKMADIIQNSGINSVAITSKKDPAKKTQVIGNNTVDITTFVKGVDLEELGSSDGIVYYPALLEILDRNSKKSKKVLLADIIASKDDLIVRHITIDDMIAAISYNLNMTHGLYVPDNIDHLSNRRVRSVGELLQNQLRVGMSRLERVVKERMLSQDPEGATANSLINTRPVYSAIKEFFGTSQLSQFMDQSNPIAELTHKRKLSALGPGGLTRDRAGFAVRDVHHSHYGRMCPVETPEGQNIGLITSLSSYARIDEHGFIVSPYRKIDKKNGVVTDEVKYMTADEEDNYYIVQANEPLDENQRFVNSRVTCRYLDRVLEVNKDDVDYMDVNPQQLVSVAASLIPFLENDDANRALMGSNMQRQAVPLMRPQSPIIGTGMEHKVAVDSGVCIIAEEAGVVSYVSANKIEVKSKNEINTYELKKFTRSNQATCINQRPIVNVGDKVKKGDILADGPSIDNGELALGRNVLIGFMSWEGFNYEDAILINEDLVENDIFTSIHIEKYEIDSRTVQSKLGVEEITRDIPNVGEDALKNLDENGIVRVGAEVKSGDYLVGKVTPKGESELTPEEKLLRAIFGDRAKEVRDVSLKVPNGEGGIVVDVKIFTRANKDDLAPGVNQLVRVFVAQKRKIGVGDKMAGRHGNKGVISKVLPREDMPFLEDGTPLDIVLNPLGVPSRMNLGQVLEVHLGLISNKLGIKIETPVFDGANEHDIKQMFKDNGLTHIDPVTKEEYVDGKIKIFDGRTGEEFENPVTVGYMYMLKLIHLVDDKIHARSTGPYALVTQQPLGGKAQFGGQRFGEMEVWALEAYGASNILQEILTIKSDDVMGRQRAYNSIVKTALPSSPGVPESFKVLQKELQSLCLDVKLLTGDAEEVDHPEFYDEEHEDLAMRTTPLDIELDDQEMDYDTEDIIGLGIGDLFDSSLDFSSDEGEDPFGMDFDKLGLDLTSDIKEDMDLFGQLEGYPLETDDLPSAFDSLDDSWLEEEHRRADELLKQKEDAALKLEQAEDEDEIEPDNNEDEVE